MPAVWTARPRGAYDAMDNARTILDLIEYQARQQPEALALLDGEGTGISYGDLAALLLRSETVLDPAGAFHPGDRIATVLHGGLDAAIGFLATACVACAAPLDPRLGREEFIARLTALRVRALLAPPRLGTAAFDAARACGVPVIDSDSLLLSAPIQEGERSPRRSPPQEDDIALLLSTSGTTAVPKRVPLSHRNLVMSAKSVAANLDLTPNDRCLNVMPLFHIHGLVAGLLASLAAGASVLCAPGFAEAQFIEWLGSHEPTWYTAVPTIHQSLLTELERRGAQTPFKHSLRLARSSSSALPQGLMRSLEERLNIPLIEAYGMTEATHQVASNPLPPDVRKPGSVGRPTRVDVAILNSKGDIEQSQVDGEIVIRGETVIRAYESDDEANARAFIDGWFRTGDIGRFDEDGYLYLTGRQKEMINRGGEKVAPREVDDALLTHPAVVRALAFAVPHRTLGEDVAAAVVLRDGKRTSEADLRGYLLERLAPSSVPSRFLFVDQLPTGPTGKPQRIGLHKLLEAQMREPFRPPSTPIETALAAMWRELIDADSVGAADNFFLLGGDSLSTARLLSRIERRFGVRLTLREAFESPRLEDLAALVESAILARIEEQGDA